MGTISVVVSLAEPQQTSTPAKNTTDVQMNGDAKHIRSKKSKMPLGEMDTNIDMLSALHSKGNISTSSTVPLVQTESPGASPNSTVSTRSLESGDCSLTDEVGLP